MRYAFAMLVVAAVTVPAFGEGPFGPNATPGQGDWEIKVSGTGANDRKFSDGSFELTADVGTFVTQEVLVALRQSVSYTSFAPGDAWGGNTRVAADYHFDLGNFQPFIGANLGYVYGDNVRDTWAAGPEAGVKYYMQDNAFLFLRAEYQFFFRRARDADDGFRDGNFLYTVGAGLNF